MKYIWKVQTNGWCKGGKENEKRKEGREGGKSISGCQWISGLVWKVENKEQASSVYFDLTISELHTK